MDPRDLRRRLVGSFRQRARLPARRQLELRRHSYRHVSPAIVTSADRRANEGHRLSRRHFLLAGARVGESYHRKPLNQILAVREPEREAEP